MLPQIKRPQRSEDGDVEIEVVDVRNVDGSEISDDDPTMLAQNTLFPKGGSASRNGTNSTRPPAQAAAKASVSLGNLTNKRSSKREAFGDEPTRLMPSKHGAKSLSSRPPAASPSQSVRPGALPHASSPPPAPDSRAQGPLPNSSLVKGTSAEFRPPAVPSSRRPSPPPAFRDREESHTMLRPLGALAETAQHDPKVSLAVPSAGAIKAQVDAARAKRLADQKARAAETLEVTPVSISERFVVQGRPAAPWAFAFVAMGIFAGLATAVFTGGHASSIASFIDPARLGIAAAAAQPAAPPAPAAQPANDPAANMATTTPAAPAAVDPALSLLPTTPTTVFAVGHASAKATDTTPAPTPVAHAAPKAETPKPTPVAKVDPPAAKSDPAPVAKADPKPAPAADKSSDSSSHGSKSTKGKHGGGSEVDSAAAADALAKAQLENSL